MTSAAAVFCCLIVLAFVQGFGSPAFVAVIASDAIEATLPFLGFLIVARFAAMRMPTRARLITRIYVATQCALVALSFGWWWIEPHKALAAMSSGSLASMAWQALAGGVVGLILALLAEGRRNPTLFREVWLGAGVIFLIGGGRLYRVFDHVEAGNRLSAAVAIVAGVAALAMATYLLLRERQRLAGAIPALAPPVACLVLLAVSFLGAPVAATSRDSVLLVVVDTLRADITEGGFAADREAMPEFARLAKLGVLFTQAISPAPWTLPATVSLLSGWNPHRHRYGASASGWEVLRGDPSAMYLAGALRDAGYLTSAFVNNPYLRPYYGFDKGFYTMRPYHGRAIDGVALALDWQRAHVGAPSFMMLHLMDPHWPYEAPPGYGPKRQDCGVCDSLFYTQFVATTPSDREEVRRRYAAEVAYTDAMLGRLYDTLRAGGALEHTWVVVTADHGEEFWEHGKFMHGHALYDELLRVPLLVIPPSGSQEPLPSRGLRVTEQVRLEDVGATIGDIAGLDPKLAPDGRSLLGLIAAQHDANPRVVVAGYLKSPEDLIYAVRRPPWKAMVTQQMIGNTLFQLETDPGESLNLLFRPETPPLKRLEFNQVRKSLLLEPASLGLSVTREQLKGSGMVPDADTQRDLRSLGYAQ